MYLVGDITGGQSCRVYYIVNVRSLYTNSPLYYCSSGIALFGLICVHAFPEPEYYNHVSWNPSLTVLYNAQVNLTFALYLVTSLANNNISDSGAVAISKVLKNVSLRLLK